MQDNSTLISEVAFEVSDSTDAPIDYLVPCETHPTEIVEDFTKADDFYDDNGPVFDLLFERVSSGFRKLRSELPFILRFKNLIAARPHNPQTHKLTTPFHGCYSWEEICVDLLHRDSSTVRKLFIDVKSPSQLAAEKAARIHTQHVAQNAATVAASGTPTVTDALNEELSAKVRASCARADEAVAGRNVAVETARQDGFANGVSVQQAFTAKLEAAAVTHMDTEIGYGYAYDFDGVENEFSYCGIPQPLAQHVATYQPVHTRAFDTLAEAVANLPKEKRRKQAQGRTVTIVKWVTVTTQSYTPCELPPDEVPAKKSKKNSPAVEEPSV